MFIKPVEKLIKQVKCDNIRGKTIANLIIESLKNKGIDISYCRSQTYDGAGNGRKTKQSSSKFPKRNTQNDRALNYHCASHELNLALTKASKVPEVFNMVFLLQSLGLLHPLKDVYLRN